MTKATSSFEIGWDFVRPSGDVKKSIGRINKMKVTLFFLLKTDLRKKCSEAISGDCEFHSDFLYHIHLWNSLTGSEAKVDNAANTG